MNNKEETLYLNLKGYLFFKDSEVFSFKMAGLQKIFICCLPGLFMFGDICVIPYQARKGLC